MTWCTLLNSLPPDHALFTIWVPFFEAILCTGVLVMNLSFCHFTLKGWVSSIGEKKGVTYHFLFFFKIIFIVFEGYALCSTNTTILGVRECHGCDQLQPNSTRPYGLHHPPVKWSKSGPAYPTPFLVRPLLNPGLIFASPGILCSMTTNTGHVWLEGK